MLSTNTKKEGVAILQKVSIKKWALDNRIFVMIKLEPSGFSDSGEWSIDLASEPSWDNGWFICEEGSKRCKADGKTPNLALKNLIRMIRGKKIGQYSRSNHWKRDRILEVPDNLI